MKAFALCATTLFFAFCCSNSFSQEKDSSLPTREYKIAVACVANASGTKHPVLQKSSGYRQLDQAALEAAKYWCPTAPTRPMRDATQSKPSRTS